MTVGYDKALELIIIVLKICYVRYDKVYTEHVSLRKCKSAVHNYYTVFIFEGSDIHPDLLKSSKGDYLKL